MGVQERRAKQKESLRQDILDAARQLFVRDGYESVSMRKIADKVEYSPGTLYLHFRDKAEILDCLCEETFAKLEQKCELIQNDQGDALEGLRRALRMYVEFGLQNPNHYLVTFVLSAGQHQVPDSETRKMHAGLRCFGRLREIVARCAREGRLASNDVEETTQALWAGVHGVTSLLITQCGFPFIEQSRLIQRVVDILIEGVRAR